MFTVLSSQQKQKSSAPPIPKRFLFLLQELVRAPKNQVYILLCSFSHTWGSSYLFSIVVRKDNSRNLTIFYMPAVGRGSFLYVFLSILTVSVEKIKAEYYNISGTFYKRKKKKENTTETCPLCSGHY